MPVTKYDFESLYFHAACTLSFSAWSYDVCSHYPRQCSTFGDVYYLIKNSQAVKKGAAPIKAMVKKDVKSKVAAKKWL